MNPDDWKPEEQNRKEENLIQPFRSRNINTAPEPEKVPNVQPAGRAAEVDINKFKFKQKRIMQYFKSKSLIDFEIEIQELERERLRDMKKKKELEWQERKNAEVHRKAVEWATQTLDIITEEAWARLCKKEDGRRTKRLETASLKTLTGRVRNWSLSIQWDPNEHGKKRRKEQTHADSPSKRRRAASKSIQQGDWDGGRTSVSNQREEDHTVRSGINKPKYRLSNHQEDCGDFNKTLCGTGKHASTGCRGDNIKTIFNNLNLPKNVQLKKLLSPTQPPKQPQGEVNAKIIELEKQQNPKKTSKETKIPQVKTRKWVRKKNGLFGWVTSISEGKPSAPREVATEDILAGGRGKLTSKENMKTTGGGDLNGLLGAAGPRRAERKVKAEPGEEGGTD